jgi:hypothetical protein
VWAEVVRGKSVQPPSPSWPPPRSRKARSPAASPRAGPPGATFRATFPRREATRRARDRTR